MQRFRHCALVACITLAVADSSTLWGAIITWGTPTDISTGTNAALDVSTYEQLVYAYGLGGASSQIVNGVTFAPWTQANNFTSSTSPGGNAALTANAPTNGSGDYAGFGNGGSAGPVGALNTNAPSYYNLITNEVFNYDNGSPTSMTLTLNNLTIGAPYQFEMWVDESRAQLTVNRTDVLSTAGGPSVTLEFNNTQTPNGVGQFVIGTFVADATTQNIMIAGGRLNDLTDISPQLAAFELRSVPEPTSCLLLAFGTIGLAVAARRGRARCRR